jgi:dTMP kinase
MRGKIIVFEGLDGSGKATQLELLKQRLVGKRLKAVSTECPRYDKFYGKLTGRYLSGEFGAKEEVSPYLASLLYASDRLNEKEDILKWIEENDFVLINRYVSSSEAFLGARFLGVGERMKFIEWLNVMEYDINKLRKPHLVIFLDVPPEIGQKLVLEKGHREYMNGTVQDIHERDIEFQKEVRVVYNELSSRDNWVKVECAPDGELRSMNDIAEEIWKAILPLLPPRT